VDLIIRRAIFLIHRLAPPCPGDGFSGGPYGHEAGLERRRVTESEARGTSSEGERFWLDDDLFEIVTETPSDQETADVWADLDASANLADSGGALEDGDGVACFCETVGGREAAEAAADDDDVDGKGGATTLEEVGGRAHGDRERKRVIRAEHGNYYSRDGMKYLPVAWLERLGVGL
jgi:hypothetical protein